MAVNEKLVDRGIRIISQLTHADEKEAKRSLIEADMSVKTAVVMIYHSVDCEKARNMIKDNNGMLRNIIS